MRTAVNVEPENMQMDMLTSAMATVREDEEVRQPIEDKIGRVVRKRLGGFAEHFTEVTEIEGEVIEGQVKLIEAPRQRKPRGEFHQHQEELRQYLAEHPGATVREMAAHFGKKASTMQGWLDKFNMGA